MNKRNRRFLGRHLHQTLRADQIRAVGPDALMVSADIVLTTDDDTTPGGTGPSVLPARVMTDVGAQVGTVTDVVVDTGTGKVVGYELCPADQSYSGTVRRAYLPLPETGAVSGEALVVPATAVDSLAGDLAGFATTFGMGKTATARAWLPFGNVIADGADAQLLEVPDELSSRITDCKALGGRVLTDRGREIGPLQGIDIDDEGSITALITAAGPIAAADLIAIGSYAVVVTDHNDPP